MAPHKSQAVPNKGSQRTFKRGANSDYYLARLKRDRPDIAERYRNGKFKERKKGGEGIPALLP